MKILSKRIEKNGSGEIKIQVDKEDDVYYLYNIISIDDVIRSTSTRNIIHESSTGSTEKTKTKINITINVEKIEFDADKCSLRVQGRNIVENEKVKMGQYHSIDIEVGKQFTVSKEKWDENMLSNIDDASQTMTKEHIIVIVMQFGLANICMVGSEATLTIAKIEKSIPKKKIDYGNRDKAIIDFFKSIYESLHRLLIKFEFKTCVIIGSPGFLNIDFKNFVIEHCQKMTDQTFLACANKFLTCHASSGYKSSISEILSDVTILSKIEGFRIVNEIRCLEKFHRVLTSDTDKACYGLKEIMYANSLQAIEDLLITDTLFKCIDPQKRIFYQEIIDQVLKFGGNVFKFGSRNVSGVELDQYTGIAAILRFPVPELQNIESVDIDTNITPKNTDLTNKSIVMTIKNTKIKNEDIQQSKLLGIGPSNDINVEEYDEFDEFDELDAIGLELSNK